MNLTPELMVNIGAFLIPFGIFGFVKAMTLFRDVIAMKFMGKVKAFITTENGQLKEKWIKPTSGQIKSKDGTSKFNFNVGYMWRKGFFPVTVIDGKEMMQVNLMNQDRDDTGAKDSSNLIIRSYNEGYLDGFKKNKMLNNFIYIIMLFCAVSAVVGILGYNQNMQILNLVGGG